MRTRRQQHRRHDRQTAFCSFTHGLFGRGSRSSSRTRRAADPFPFPFLCFWASVEAIFLSLFIMISQNLQSQKDRVATELEYRWR